MFEMKNLLIRKVGGSMLLEAQKKKVKRQAFLALSSVVHGAHISAYLEVRSWCGSYPRRKSYKTQLLVVTCWYIYVVFFLFFRGGQYGTSHFSKGWWDHPRLIERALNRDLPARMEDLEKKKKEPHIPWLLGGVTGSPCVKRDCVSLTLSQTGERRSILIFLHSYTAAAILGITRTSWPGHEVCLTKMPHLRCSMVRWFRYRNEHIAMRVGQANVGHGMRNIAVLRQNWTSKIRVWQRTRCKHFTHVPEKLPHICAKRCASIPHWAARSLTQKRRC